MSNDPGQATRDREVAETLHRILAVQIEFLAQFRSARQADEARFAAGLEIQQRAAQRSQLAIETQQGSARLYRRVVMVAAAILGMAVLGGIYPVVFG